MLNGAIQILESGLVPGNRNADNVDKLLEQYEYVLYPSRSIQTDGIKAVSVTSFGFGQKVHRLLLFIQITYLLFWIDPLMKNMLLRSLLEIKRPTVTCTMQSPETLCLLPKTKLHIVTNWNNQFTWIHWLVLKKTRKSWYSVTKQFNRANLILEKLLKNC